LNSEKPTLERAIRLEPLPDTLNGDAHGVMVEPACQLPEFLQTESSAGSTQQKRRLPCAAAAEMQKL
jgi:hypothetical protein